MTNVVYVHTDDTGRYVGPYGYDVETPGIQTLAEEGVLFRDAHTAAPTCSPSRAAQMTGAAPHSSGMVGLAHRGFSLSDYDRHLSGYLSDHGFESVCAGQQHEIGAGDERVVDSPAAVLGYDRVLTGDEGAVGDLPIDSESTRTDLANAAAVADYLGSDPEEPFFLSLGLFNTHQPMPLEQDLVDPDHVEIPAPLPDHPDVRREIAAYHVLVNYVDECVGQVLDALRGSGLLDETVVVFSTDHGAPFPHMKCNLFEDGTGISLIARFPDDVADARGRTEDAIVSNVDLVPTLCEATDTPIPEWVQGNSLLPLVRGERGSVREEVFTEVTYHAAYEPKRCVRTDRYVYIRRYGDGEGEPQWERDAGPVPRVAPNTDHGPSKDIVQDAGLFDRPFPREALYDRTLDPAERENLVAASDHQNVRDDLADRLEDWMEKTGDPLLDGPVSKPEGAIADRRDALHPDEGDYEPETAR
jgi:arylsulfatase A-like enzyme